MSHYYFLCFVLSLFFLWIYVIRWDQRYYTYFSMLYLFTCIANLGYWQIATATSLDQAILANKIAYLGGAFLSLALMLCVFEVCKIHLRKSVRVGGFLISILMYCSCLSVGYKPWFYKSVTWKALPDGTHIMVKEYGPLHTAFYGMLFLYMLFSVAVILYSYVKKRNVSLQSAGVLAATIGFNMAAFFIGRAIGGVELICFSYVVSLAAFLLILDRLVLYEYEEKIVDTLTDRKQIGMAVFERNRRFRGCNQAAAEYYPPFAKLHIDKKMDETDPELTELRYWMDELEQQETLDFIYILGNVWYRVVANYRAKGRSKSGYHFVIMDYSREQEKNEQLEHLANADQLTGLGNRRAYEQQIEQIQKTGMHENLVLISSDTNGLKHINDTLGHVAGDELIQACADCFVRAFSHLGSTYRTGGDEFISILIADPDELDAALTALNKKLKLWKGQYVNGLSVSNGIAAHRDYPELSVEQLEVEADRLMYEQKRKYYQANQ